MAILDTNVELFTKKDYSQNTFAPVSSESKSLSYAPIMSYDYNLILNSPESGISTKKDLATSAESRSIPSISSAPSQEQSSPISGSSNWILIGALAIGGAFLLSGGRK